MKEFTDNNYTPSNFFLLTIYSRNLEEYRRTYSRIKEESSTNIRRSVHFIHEL